MEDFVSQAPKGRAAASACGKQRETRVRGGGR